VDDDLHAVLDALAARECLLVGVDFDGTLAPFQEEPMDVAPVPGAMPVLKRLAEQDGVTVAVVSGRALQALRTLTGAGDAIVLIGSHGAESSRSAVEHQLTPQEQDQLGALEQDLHEGLDDHPHARLEHKPSAIVLHTRGMPSGAADAATRVGEQVAARHTGVHTTPGKDVLEMAVTEAGKGPALLDLAEAVGAQAILYAGDDVTDERAFEHLRPHDVSIKVGAGETCARHRLASEGEVVEMLEHLLRARTERASVTDPIS